MPVKWFPHNYQLTAVCYSLATRFGGLFLSPGLGKTSIMLQVIKTLRGAGMIGGTLVVAPLRVCYSVWPGEIKKWSTFNSLSYTILHDDTKHTLWGKQKDIYIINPESLDWLYWELIDNMEKGKKCPFNVLIVDESTKFKNPKSKRFELLRDMAPLFRRRYLLTGTPAPRGLMDLWPQLFLIDRGASLGKNFYSFRRRYFAADDWNKYNYYLKDGAADKIHAAIAPVVLEMDSKEYLSMPPITFNNIAINLPKSKLVKYKQMERVYFTELDGNELTAQAAAQAGIKCQQMANGKVYEDVPENLPDDQVAAFKRTRKVIPVHSVKIDALADLLGELQGAPVLIAYKFKHDLAALRKLLGPKLAHIGSGVTPIATDRLCEQWNNGELPYVACQPQSMSHGLNLQAGGNDIIWFSLTWNLEEYLQFNARVYRQGVTGAVRVHHIIARDTIDEAMLIRLGERAKVQSDLRLALRRYRKKLAA